MRSCPHGQCDCPREVPVGPPFQWEAKEQLPFTESLMPCLPLNQKRVLCLPGLLEPRLLIPTPLGEQWAPSTRPRLNK